MDADDLIFAQFLGEGTRARMEEAGRTELSAADVRLVGKTRQTHAILLPPAIVAAVLTAPALARRELQLAGVIPLAPFLVGWAVEIWVRVRSHERDWRREVSKGVASFFVGYAVFLAFFFFVAGGSYGTTWQHGHLEDDDSGR